MKILVSIILLLALIAVGSMAVPTKMYFQGKFTDDLGDPMDGDFPVTFTIWDSPITGTPFWTESRTITFNTGLFAEELGLTEALPESIFTGAMLYLEMVVDGDVIEPRKPLITVPYAFRAAIADSVVGGSVNYDMLVTFIEAYLDTAWGDSVSHIDLVHYIDSVMFVDSITYIYNITHIDSIHSIDSVSYIRYVSFIDSISYIDSVRWIDSISYVDFISFIDSVGYIDSIGWIGHTAYADSAGRLVNALTPGTGIDGDPYDGSVPLTWTATGGSGDVTSLNTLTGDLNIIGEGAITVTDADPNIRVGLILDPGDCTGFVDIHDGVATNQNVPVKVQAFNPTVGQFLLLNTDVGCTGGRIRAITFYSNVTGGTIENVDVFMDNVVFDNLAGRNPLYGEEVVTSMDASVSGDGSVEIILDHGFFYRGDNLLITVRKNASTGMPSSWFGEATGSVMARYNNASSGYPLPTEENFAPHVLLDFFPPEIPNVVTRANGLNGDVRWVGSDDITVLTGGDSIRINYISGTALTAAHSDHTHEAVGPGDIAYSDSTGAVAWGDIAGIPAGFADGVDDTGTTGIDADWQISGDDMYSLPTGDVGIGTTSPAVKLDVNGAVRTSRLGAYGTYSASEVQGIWSISSGYTIDVGSDDFGRQYGIGYAYNRNGGSPFAGEHQIVFTNNGAINAAIGLGGSGYFAGNVGIGTTTPEYDLDVEGVIKTNYLYPGSGGDPYRFIRFGDPDTFWAGFMWNNSSGGYGNGDDFTIYTYGGRDIVLKGGETHILGGDVGIGTTSPQRKLHIADGRLSLSYSSAQSWIEIMGGGDGVTHSAVYLCDEDKDNRSDWVIGHRLNDHVHIAYYDAGGSHHDVMVLTDDGQVGIGTGPSYQLHLSSNSAAKPTSSSWTVISDGRLKTNIMKVLNL